MKIGFVGDFMLSGDQNGKPLFISRKLSKRFLEFDFRVATLETAVGSYGDIDDIKSPKSQVAVWSKPEDLHKLQDLNINLVSLANNHACDCGVNCMLQLLDTLRELGVTPIGAGRNVAEAMRPAVFEKDGESIAIIGCCKDAPDSLGTLHFATETKGGIYRLDETIVLPQIKELKRQYSYVAVVVHWGVEHKWLPENEDVAIGKKMIDAGADMIIGGHPHHIQPVIPYRNRPVFYSLGNFYFPDFCLDKVSNTYYPKKEEFDNLPVFDWMAPAKRKFAMRYFWKYYGRLGMIASVKLNQEIVKTNYFFSVYHKGRISVSSIGKIHTIKLKLLSPFAGTPVSSKINEFITRVNSLFEYKVMSRFVKKYSFFEYMTKHNSDNN